MQARERLHGLYAITDATLQRPDQLAGHVAEAIEGGATIIQYRDKSSDHEFRLWQARQLAGLCREHEVPLIINDDVQLAIECGAQGVHLGDSDTDPGSARHLLGDDAIIGISCYNRWQRAEQSAQLDVDYIAFGRFFPSRTKPKAAQANLELLTRASRELALPVAAIGGITPHNGDALVLAGARMLAVVQGVFASTDIRQAATAYANLFK